MLEQLIEQLADELQMKEFIISPEPGTYTLSFDPNILITIKKNIHTCLIKSEVGSLPQNNIDNFLVKLMEANLFGRGTRGGVLGLNKEGNLLTLSLEVDYNSSYKDFKNKLEDFVSVLNFWRDEMNK